MDISIKYAIIKRKYIDNILLYALKKRGGNSYEKDIGYRRNYFCQ